MITRHRLHDVTDVLSREYADLDGRDYTIDHMIKHGSALIVCFTRTYVSTIGGKHEVRENRVAIFKRHDNGKMHKHSDMIADVEAQSNSN